MRHRNGIRKLGRDGQHRRALLRNLAVELFDHERIFTTLGKARALRPFAERLITLAKDGKLHARRCAAREVQDHRILQKLFADLGGRFADRPGGYTRTLKVQNRRGDNAPMALIELVTRQDQAPGDAAAAPAKGSAPASDAADDEAAVTPA